MLSVAFKEWAVICQALEQGRQTILLRKGGIAEDGGEFQVEHQRFWLFPTYTHQQQTGIRSEAQSLLDQAELDRPAPGIVRLRSWMEVNAIHWVEDEAALLRLAPMHFWSEATVRQRFAYRRPGLFVLLGRVYQLEKPVEIEDHADYQGCKSWVPLKQGISVEGSTPVVSDEDFGRMGLWFMNLMNHEKAQ